MKLLVLPALTLRSIEATVWARSSHLADRVGALAARRPAIVLALWSVVYFAATASLASRKLLWDDEFFSLYISRSSLSSIWSALLTGADQHPPSFYWLSHFSMLVFGENSIALRLPALVGFWLMGLCLFRFVGRSIPPLHGYAVLLFPTVTAAYFYAYEARGYGPMLGFASLSLVCWQEAAAATRFRRLALIGLAASLAAAVSCHYYAILLLVPLGLGELTRAVEQRRFDWAVWATFLSPGAPLVFFLPMIRAARGFAPTFWAVPSWSSLPEAFEVLLRPTRTAAVGIVVLGVYRFLRSGSSVQAAPEAAAAPPRHETVAALGLVAVPLVGITLAKLTTNAFHLRYVLIVILGFSILLPLITLRLFPTRAAAVALLAVLSMAFAIRWADSFGSVSGARRSLETSIAFLAARPEAELPIAAAEVGRFYQLSYYAPPTLARRMVYLADPASAIRYFGHDTLDRCLVALKPWFGVNVEDYTSFVRTRRFLLYDSIGDTWHTFKLTRDGVQTTLLARDGKRALFRVDPLDGQQTPAAQHLR